MVERVGDNYCHLAIIPRQSSTSTQLYPNIDISVPELKKIPAFVDGPLHGARGSPRAAGLHIDGAIATGAQALPQNYNTGFK